MRLVEFEKMKSGLFRGAGLAALLATLSACSGLVGQPGPTARAIADAPNNKALSGIVVIDLDRDTVLRTRSRTVNDSFADAFGTTQPVATIVRPGDVLEVSIWEAPPATLFAGSGTTSARDSANAAVGTPEVSTNATLPELLVDGTGTIFVPFVGAVSVAGRSVREIERDISTRLQKKAHLPQVVVRLVRNTTATVTVVGEVVRSTRMALSPKGERLLDALAQAGGATQPVNRMVIQLTRGDRVLSMPLESVIRDPRQNIILSSDDVVTAVYQPFTFTALGASGKNEEVKFEATGLTLAQALGRIGGLQADRANAKGIFIFRWEDPANLPPSANPQIAQNGKVPVIYRVDLRDPATFFLSQQFDVRNDDLVYVSTAPIAEFQQFVNVVASTVLPLIAVRNSVN
ncbi:polysaccharide biosynthesis/export family protein [Sphingomonas elodea]|uniref:polysaccharide biosynthesis/export family protein n=1 Tax=Sphingomonas elodea TaxID=179878 RepID=UPI001ED97587|nr:polysaccharide biosynthesis/export family protein [Sphingomonas elodea]